MALSTLWPLSTSVQHSRPQLDSPPLERSPYSLNLTLKQHIRQTTRSRTVTMNISSILADAGTLRPLKGRLCNPVPRLHSTHSPSSALDGSMRIFVVRRWAMVSRIWRSLRRRKSEGEIRDVCILTSAHAYAIERAERISFNVGARGINFIKYKSCDWINLSKEDSPILSY
jgi:hypothetical protein